MEQRDLARRVLLTLLLVVPPAPAFADIIGMQVERKVTEADMKASLREVELVDEKGAPLDLNALMGSGKPTLVSLWAHWCPNCLGEVSGYKAIAKACPRQWNIVFVSARAGDYPKDLAKFKSFGLPWKFYHVGGSSRDDVAKAKAARAFYGETVEGGVVTPMHYFIDASGAVEAIVAGKMDFTEPDRLAAFCGR
ncbi:MAG: TlpA family protein disulfide reductase [Methylocystis sp.]|uniref:TlpA family protein disulfide reductase n=1 Tax=Methylocystis sp. TaxID=1911079 RepID=UPI003DA5209F